MALLRQDPMAQSKSHLLLYSHQISRVHCLSFENT